MEIDTMSLLLLMFITLMIYIKLLNLKVLSCWEKDIKYFSIEELNQGNNEFIE